MLDHVVRLADVAANYHPIGCLALDARQKPVDSARGDEIQVDVR
jgi:hypothetical protein